jgi:hypothetical protein
MACELERSRYTDLQKKADKDKNLQPQASAAYKALKDCEGVAYERAEAKAEREAREKMYAQQAETAAMYARGEHMKDIKIGPEYAHKFDVSKYLPKVKEEKGPSVGLIVAGVLGGGIFLLIILYFLMKGKSGPRYGGYPPPYKRKKRKRRKKKRK